MSKATNCELEKSMPPPKHDRTTGLAERQKQQQYRRAEAIFECTALLLPSSKCTCLSSSIKHAVAS